MALVVVIYGKLGDTLIAEEWMDMITDFVMLFVFLTFTKWVFFNLLGFDARAEKAQREQAAKTAASLDGASADAAESSIK